MQLPAEKIEITLPVPAPVTEQLYLVSLDVGRSTVRLRRVDFVVREADAKALWRLRRSERFETAFAMEVTGDRVQFVGIEHVRFDLAHMPGQATYTVGQVARIAKFDI